MKKTIITVFAISLLLTVKAGALEIIGIDTDTSFIERLDRDVADDAKYLRNIAAGYGNRFVVEEKDYADITPIDRFFEELSAPVTLAELDSGHLSFNTETIYSEELKKEWNLFKMMGGLSGCKAVFEPVVYFNIYRNITLVGGYVKYNVSDGYYGEAYWRYICGVEDMTKEIISLETRLNLLEKTKQMYDNIENDNSFKVFLLVDGAINSIWERDAE